MINSNFFLIAFTICLGAISGYGPDSSSYWQWSNYFQHFDINIFNNLDKSKNGLPITSWYYGSGIIPAILNNILWFDIEISKKINTILLTSINIFLIYKLLTQKNIYGLKNLSIICAFLIFFPGGYYLNKFSSEFWSVFSLLASLYFIEKKKNEDLKIYAFIIGFCLYLLILIKPNNIFLSLAVISIFFIKNVNNINLKNIFSKKFLYVGILLFFLFLGVSLILLFQKILMGSYFTSFYSFGDENVRSFSLKNLNIIEVLFSSWHGLIFYHPFYVLLNFYLFSLIFNKNITYEIKKIVVINTIIFILQILIQSSWAFWWMGTGTYGARGFAGVSVITLYLSILVLKEGLIPKKTSLVLFTLLLLWNAFLIYFGNTNFVNYQFFFEKVFRNHSLIIIIKLITVSFLILLLIKVYKKSEHIFIYCSLVAISFFIIISKIFSDFNIQNIFYSIIVIFVLKLLLILLNKNLFLTKFFSFKKDFLIFVLISTILLLSLNFQYKLFTNFNLIKNNNYSRGVNFHCKNLEETLNEYETYDKFNEELIYWKKFYKKNCIINS